MKSSTEWCDYFCDAALALHKNPSTFHIPVEETNFQLQGQKCQSREHALWSHPWIITSSLAEPFFLRTAYLLSQIWNTAAATFNAHLMKFRLYTIQSCMILKIKQWVILIVFPKNVYIILKKFFKHMTSGLNRKTCMWCHQLVRKWWIFSARETKDCLML